MNHLIVEIVLRKPASVSLADGDCTALDHVSQLVIVELFLPVLNATCHAPEDIVPAQRDVVFIGPSQDCVDGAVLHIAPRPLHLVPLQSILGYCRIEVVEEYSLVLGYVFRVGSTGKRPV